MTTYKPKKSLKVPLGLMGLLILAGGELVGWLFIYNLKVNIQHDRAEFIKEMAEAKTMNAELKNNLYNILNPGNIEAVMAERGLVREKSPRYIQVSRL